MLTDYCLFYWLNKYSITVWAMKVSQNLSGKRKISHEILIANPGMLRGFSAKRRNSCRRHRSRGTFGDRTCRETNWNRKIKLTPIRSDLNFVKWSEYVDYLLTCRGTSVPKIEKILSFGDSFPNSFDTFFIYEICLRFCIICLLPFVFSIH